MAKRSKAFRTYISVVRSLKYGVENFVRNIGISLAAILVMSLTLLIVFLTVVSNDILNNAIYDVRQKVDMSIYLSNKVDKVTVKNIYRKLTRLSNVKEVKFISSEQSRKEFIASNNQDDSILEAISESPNKFPAIFRIKLHDIEDTSQLVDMVKTDQELITFLDQNNQPSFMANDGKETIGNIAKYANFAEKLGIIAVSLFTLIALLVMFNTVRMAIFNYKNEISIMKLIGAKRWFIRTPFLVEAMIDGMIASLIASLMGYYMVNTLKDVAATQWLIESNVIEKTTNILYNQWYLVILVMMLMGMMIGLISSSVAIRRYLKFKA